MAYERVLRRQFRYMTNCSRYSLAVERQMSDSLRYNEECKMQLEVMKWSSRYFGVAVAVLKMQLLER